MKKTDKKFFYILLFSMELALVLIAFIIIAVKKQSIASTFTTPALLAVQVSVGIISGLVIGVLCTILVFKIPIFSIMHKLVKKLITTYKLNLYDLILISVLAGVCEEILFRGVLQPMWGIWITSFVFILLHGYFNPFNWKLTLFGVMMFGISIILGYIYITLGLAAAISFHFSFDLIVLLLIFFKLEKQNAT